MSHFGHSLQLPNPPQLYGIIFFFLGFSHMDNSIDKILFPDNYENHEDKLFSKSSSPDIFNDYDSQFG